MEIVLPPRAKRRSFKLRIFALIRLGITESEQISEILGYSVNTVYNYRVRTRNKAVDPANFEKNIRKIGL